MQTGVNFGVEMYPAELRSVDCVELQPCSSDLHRFPRRDPHGLVDNLALKRQQFPANSAKSAGV